MTRFLAAAIAAASLAIGAAPASALAPATITTVQTAPRTFQFTSTPCQFGFCSYTWQAYVGRTTRRYAQLGFTNPVTASFPAGDYSITVAVGGKCSATSQSNCPTSGSTFIHVV